MKTANPEPRRTDPTHARDISELGMLPSASLYMCDALRDGGVTQDWASRRLGPHTYRLGRVIVVVRTLDADEAERVRDVLTRENCELVYIIDDDLHAMVDDGALPKAYRRRLAAFVQTHEDFVVNAARTIVVASRHLEALFRRRGKDVVFLDPYWSESAAPVHAHDGAAPDITSPVTIAWLATRSHLADLKSVQRQLRGFLREHAAARLIVYIDKRVPVWLRALPGVEYRATLDWTRYRKALRDQRFDLAIHPVCPTPVNTARSMSKFFEHTLVDAAPLFSACVPFAQRVEDDVDCRLVAEGDWQAALGALVAEPDKARALALAARHKACRMATAIRDEQIRFWERCAGPLPRHHEGKQE
jgi:hypothetical protein